MRPKTLLVIGAVAATSALALRWGLATKPSPPPPVEDETEATDLSPPVPPPAPPAAAVGRRPAPPAVPAPEGRPNEDDLLGRMRADVTTNPGNALRLAREAERRFGETPHAAERGRIAIESLVRLNDIAEARNQAETFVRKYQGTDHARFVESLTGVHPRPSGPRSARPGPRGGTP